MDQKVLSYIRQNFVGELLQARPLINTTNLAKEEKEVIMNGDIESLINLVQENGQGAKLTLSETSIQELNRAFEILRSMQPSCACG